MLRCRTDELRVVTALSTACAVLGVLELYLLLSHVPEGGDPAETLLLSVPPLLSIGLAIKAMSLRRRTRSAALAVALSLTVLFGWCFLAVAASG